MFIFFDCRIAVKYMCWKEEIVEMVYNFFVFKS